MDNNIAQCDQQALGTLSTILVASKGRYFTLAQSEILQRKLQEDLPEIYHQRIKIMLLADAGKSQSQICKALGCSSTTARYWIHIARSGLVDQWQDSPIGRPQVVSQEYLEKLRELATHSPDEYGYAFRRWTANWLSKHLAKELGIEISHRHIKYLLKQMGLSTRSHFNLENKQPEKTPVTRILISDLNPS
jgi:transposase